MVKIRKTKPKWTFLALMEFSSMEKNRVNTYKKLTSISAMLVFCSVVEYVCNKWF